MTFTETLSLRPTTRSREVRLSNAAIDLLFAADPAPAPAPLPLAQVLRNIDRLHAGCSVRHECGLAPYDLMEYLLAARAAGSGR